MQISSCLEHGRERGGYPFSFPLHLSMVNEILVNDLDGNGLDDKCDCLVWKKVHVFKSSKGKV